MPRVALALIFGVTLFTAVSAAAVMPETAGSAAAQAACIGLVGLLHATTGFFVLTQKVGLAPRLSPVTIRLAALAAAGTLAAILAAIIVAAIRPFPVSADFAAPALTLAVGLAAACTAYAARRSLARPMDDRRGDTLARR